MLTKLLCWLNSTSLGPAYPGCSTACLGWCKSPHGPSTSYTARCALVHICNNAYDMCWPKGTTELCPAVSTKRGLAARVELALQSVTMALLPFLLSMLATSLCEVFQFENWPNFPSFHLQRNSGSSFQTSLSQDGGTADCPEAALLTSSDRTTAIKGCFLCVSTYANDPLDQEPKKANHWPAFSQQQ